ncbi:MAG: LysR family transcriptional regulator [Janthinobacterium lividum]
MPCPCHLAEGGYISGEVCLPAAARRQVRSAVISRLLAIAQQIEHEDRLVLGQRRGGERLLNLLQFVRVVEAGSFAETARRAGTSTSAMSKAISRFEAAHDVKLLHRTTHAISLTDAGERLLDGAHDLLRRAEQLDATPADLEAHRQIGYREPATGQLMPWQFAVPGSGANVRLLPRKRLVVESLSVAWATMSRGLGIGWLPAWGGLKELESGRVVEVLRDWRMPETPIHAVRLDRKQMPNRVRTLVDLLAAWAPGWAYHG